MAEAELILEENERMIWDTNENHLQSIVGPFIMYHFYALSSRRRENHPEQHYKKREMIN